MKSTEVSPALFFEPEVEIESQFHSQQCGAVEGGLRCACGALLARWVATGLELKCRRCKRTALIPFPKAPAKTQMHST